MKRKHIPRSDVPRRTHCGRLSAFARIAHETEYRDANVCRICAHVQRVIDDAAEQEALRRKRSEQIEHLADETLRRLEENP